MGIPSGRPAGTMATATYRVFDPLLPRAPAERMLRLCERFGAYGMYSQEASEAQVGQGLFQRHDAVMNFLKTEDLVLERILDLLVEDLRARFSRSSRSCIFDDCFRKGSCEGRP